MGWTRQVVNGSTDVYEQDTRCDVRSAAAEGDWR